MEGFMICGYVILPGWRGLFEPYVGFSTPRKAVSTRFFYPWLVGVLNVWKGFRFGDGTLSSPGGAGSCWLYGWNNSLSVPTV